MTAPISDQFDSEPRPEADGPDARCDAIDLAIDAALEETAPREVPEGLVERVLEASQPYLDQGRSIAEPSTYAFPVAARLALAACLTMAVCAAIWFANSSSGTRSIELMDVVVQAPSSEMTPSAPADDPVERVRSLWRLHALDYDTALADLEQVVWAVQNGAASSMVLSPGQTDMEVVENELDSVRVVARIDG